MSDDLIDWFKEADGFRGGTKAPHKWVLQAHSEIILLRARLAEVTEERDEADDLAKAAFSDGASNNIRLAEAAHRTKELEAKLAKQDDLVQAAVAAALTEAAAEIEAMRGPTDVPRTDKAVVFDEAADRCIEIVLNHITPDAQAALERVKQEARNEALREAARLVDCACENKAKVAALPAKNAAARWLLCGAEPCGAIEAAAILALMEDTDDE